MTEAVFRPQPRTNIKKIRHINYTCSPERYGILEEMAKKAGITLKELLRQMVEFSLNHADGRHD